MNETALNSLLSIAKRGAAGAEVPKAAQASNQVRHCRRAWVGRAGRANRTNHLIAFLNQGFQTVSGNCLDF